MTITTRELRGDEIAAHLDDIAAVRIAVFRDWPYLYDGSGAFEQDYLSIYLNEPTALAVGVFDGDRMVGASTASALSAHQADFASAFEGHPLRIDQIYYLAESVLLPDYRGEGLGHVFFDAREAEAKAHGFSHAAFCAVMRPFDHKDAPADYEPLGPFWEKRGYEPLDGVIARFGWKDVGDETESEKPLQFWAKAL